MPGNWLHSYCHGHHHDIPAYQETCRRPALHSLYRRPARILILHRSMIGSEIDRPAFQYLPEDQWQLRDHADRKLISQKTLVQGHVESAVQKAPNLEYPLSCWLMTRNWLWCPDDAVASSAVAYCCGGESLLRLSGSGEMAQCGAGCLRSRTNHGL